jgi:hypothetical protein
MNEEFMLQLSARAINMHTRLVCSENILKAWWARSRIVRVIAIDIDIDVMRMGLLMSFQTYFIRWSQTNSNV